MCVQAKKAKGAELPTRASTWGVRPASPQLQTEPWVLHFVSWNRFHFKALADWLHRSLSNPQANSIWF